MNTLQRIFQDNFLSYSETHDLPEYIREAGYKISVCGTEELGAHIHICEECGKEEVVYNPCHHRSCPKCSWKAKQEWLRTQMGKMLDCNHYHAVFTIPNELNKYYQRNKRVFIGIFFEAVKETIMGMCSNINFLGGEPGVIASMQTWGSTMIEHIHCHCLVTAGGVTENGKWVECKKGYLFPVNENGAMGVYRAKFLWKLRNAIFKGKINLFKGLCRAKALSEIEKLSKKEWHIHIEEQYRTGKGVLKYLAGYVKGGPIGNSRIKKYNGEKVIFTYKNSHKERKEEEMELSVDEFIRRVLNHVPERDTKMVRYWGIYSSYKKEELAELQKVMGKIEEKVEIEEAKCKRCNGHLNYKGEITGKRNIRKLIIKMEKERRDKLKEAV